MIFDLTSKKMISYEEAKSSMKLRDNFLDFMQGLISFPLNVPGTAYYKCLQIHKSVSDETSVINTSGFGWFCLLCDGIMGRCLEFNPR